MLRVVLIDDAEDVRQALAALIRNAGHQVVGEAGDGSSGVHVTLAERPDLVIIDWRMPSMDGIEATQTIRASYPSAAIVGLSSTDTPELRGAFAQAGADAFVAKRDIKGLLALVRTIDKARTDPPAADSVPPPD
jgi:DNA-binding NarL/FixJ family response regulator